MVRAGDVVFGGWIGSGTSRLAADPSLGDPRPTPSCGSHRPAWCRDPRPFIPASRRMAAYRKRTSHCPSSTRLSTLYPSGNGDRRFWTIPEVPRNSFWSAHRSSQSRPRLRLGSPSRESPLPWVHALSEGVEGWKTGTLRDGTSKGSPVLGLRPVRARPSCRIELLRADSLFENRAHHLAPNIPAQRS